MNKFQKTLLTILFLIGLAVIAQAQQVFVANLSGAQEVPAVTTGGRGVCKVVLNAAQTQITVNCEYSGLSSGASAAHIHGNGAVGVSAPVLFGLGAVSGTSGTITAVIDVTAAQVADMRTNKLYFNIHTPNNTGGEIRGQIHVANSTYNDFDGDGRQDITVFRPSSGVWYSKSSLNSSTIVKQFGMSTDIAGLNLDFDGDGISDYSLGRINPTNGQVTFYILQSQTGTLRTQQIGNVALGDSLATGDYDGDGRMDLGIYNSGRWTYVESGSGAMKTFNWGQAGDLAIPTGDFDRDGKSDFAVARPTNGVFVWYIRLSSTGQLRAFTYGLTTDTIVSPLDFDGDGAGDVVVYREANNVRTYYTLRSGDGQFAAMVWGFATDIARIGDYDGDGKNEFAAVRNQNDAFYWYFMQSSNNTFRAEQWGQTGDKP